MSHCMKESPALLKTLKLLHIFMKDLSQDDNNINLVFVIKTSKNKDGQKSDLHRFLNETMALCLQLTTDE